MLYAGDRQLVVDAARPHRGRWLVRFVGIESRDAAYGLRGVRLDATPLDRVEEDEGELWIHELVGAEVRDQAGRPIGRVSAVEFNPAHDLLVLDDGALVPVVFVVDARDGIVVIDPPEGLLDVNR